MAWQTGSFDRRRIGSIYHPFTPTQAVPSLTEVDLDELWNAGKRLILLDVDNTIVQWRGEHAAEDVLAWIQAAQRRGFELCLISNTKRRTRLERISERVGVASVKGRFKPSRTMFRLALAKFRTPAHEAVMIGDQLLTDVLGANRSGIDAIWVRQMEGREFHGTKISRMVEGFLKTQLYKALVLPEDAEPPNAEPGERTIVKQVVRFGVVGGTSFVVDYTVKKVLLHFLEEPLGNWALATIPGFANAFDSPQKAAYPFAAVTAAIIATFNSFVWNRIWTFEAQGKGRRLEQLKRFYIVAGIGAIINSSVATLVFASIPKQNAVLISSVVGAMVAAIWNFWGQRNWTFRKERR